MTAVQMADDDDLDYEIINGEKVPKKEGPRHGNVGAQVIFALGTYLREHPVGELFAAIQPNPDKPEPNRRIFEKLDGLQIAMTELELRAKWTPAVFEEWKAHGGYGETMCYEEFLDYWRYQEAETERTIRELTEYYYGEPPNEQPPELSEEDHRLLSEAWAEVARERQQQEATRAA